MTQYSTLNEGYYKKDLLNDKQIWHIFNDIFDIATSIKVASYKYGLIYSIIKSVQDNIDKNKYTFEKIFTPFTKIYWRLIVHKQLFQIAPSNITSIYKILINFVIENPHFRNNDFGEIPDDHKKKIIKEVANKCSRNVIGALFGDSDEFLYSFSKREKFLELNPLFIPFLNNYGNILMKINNYEWLRFLSARNPERVISINLLDYEMKYSIPSNFESLWKIIQEKFDFPITIYTLKQQKANQIIEINEEGILVKTERSTEIVKKDLVQKAWNNLAKDGVLYRDEHEKSTYRSSFILTLLSQFDFIDTSSKGRLSIKLKKT